MISRRNHKGAALVEYGILVGLIAVVAITSVSQLGDKISSIFRDAASALDPSIHAQSDIEIDIPATGFTVNGAGGNAVTPGEIRRLTLTNTMSEPTLNLVLDITDGTHFAIVAGDCAGTILAPGASCFVAVQAISATNGSFEDALDVYY
ncbi:Flp family type IVb pilin [Loktanella sp. DJP18]|uniref:Flp family type IVb pilin n=1 Tax=Loktanella sp. DJP18 TaxID=3409788 RepID=UPI003BB53731